MSQATKPVATVFNFQLTLEKAPYAGLLPGGEEQTTCWQDFCIANHWGRGAVKETFNRIFGDFKHDIRVLAELAMACNHMCWRFYGEFEKGHRTADRQMSELYASLFEKVNDYVYESGECSQDDISYYFEVTD